MPTSRATLAGTEAWYCRVAHNELPRSPLVQAAVLSLLHDLPRSVADEELRTLFRSKIDWSLLDANARRHFLDSLNESPPSVA